VRSIDFTIPVRTAGSRSLITAPPACPAGGQWATVATFGFADGDSDTVTSLTPCAAPAASATPALRIAVGPSAVRAGVRTRFLIRVRSSASRCVDGARVRFAGRLLHTDRDGNATVTAVFHHAALRRARAGKAGCRTATARVRVRHRSRASERSASTAAVR
jgi:hypothetical protein